MPTYACSVAAVQYDLDKVLVTTLVSDVFFVVAESEIWGEGIASSHADSLWPHNEGYRHHVVSVVDVSRSLIVNNGVKVTIQGGTWSVGSPDDHL